MTLYEDDEGTWRIDYQMPEQALAEVDSDLAEIMKQQKALEEAQQQLEAFEVVKARFYKTNRGYWLRPIIDITVRNGTETAISRAYFQGTVKSPDRSVPWVDEPFNYQIPGGIEPGEELRWRLEPNMFSEWGTADAPKDAELVVVPTRVDGPDGEELVSADGSEELAEKKAELDEKRAELVSTYELDSHSP